MFGRMEEILVVAAVFLLFFGADRIPKFARSLGESITEFKKALDPDTKDSTKKSKSMKKKKN